jgi:hypothetical protein
MTIRRILKPYKCELCGIRFVTVQKAVQHKGIAHVPTGAHKCSKCPCQFQHDWRLACHIRERHTSNPRKGRRYDYFINILFRVCA